MRLPVDRRFGSLAALSALALASATAALARPAPPPVPANGPQSDYPVVVGPQYAVRGTNFIPEDVMNYDQVGYLAADAAGGNAISGSHHTLPLPSYVEVTSLESGRTILVRLERRGPMDGTELVALSPGALAQLGAHAGTPVRVRRVNPPEEQRAMLRAGQLAPLRMDTPMSLVEVLKRKLPGQGSVSVAATGPVAGIAAGTATVAQAALTRPTATVPPVLAPRPAATPITTFTPPPSRPATVAAAPAAVPHVAAPALPPLAPRGQGPVARAASVPAAPAPAAPRVRAAPAGKFVVQAAAFASADNARHAASSLHGQVVGAGSVFRVRTGPFATRGEAEASLAKVRAAGYSDARIQTSG
jgi:rare lipoprotein A